MVNAMGLSRGARVNLNAVRVNARPTHVKVNPRPGRVNHKIPV